MKSKERDIEGTGIGGAHCVQESPSALLEYSIFTSSVPFTTPAMPSSWPKLPKREARTHLFCRQPLSPKPKINIKGKEERGERGRQTILPSQHHTNYYLANSQACSESDPPFHSTSRARGTVLRFALMVRCQGSRW